MRLEQFDILLFFIGILGVLSLLSLLFTNPFVLLVDIIGRNDVAHSSLEIVGAVIALAVAAHCYFRFTERKCTAALAAFLAFLGAGIVDIIHGILGLAQVAFLFTEPWVFIPGSWLAGRLIMAIAFFGGGRYIYKNISSAESRQLLFNWGAVIGLFSINILAILLLFRPPLFLTTAGIISRPWELLPLAFFAAALPRYYEKDDLFRRLLTASILLGIITQLHMAFSGSVARLPGQLHFDTQFMLAHVFKLLSYAVVIPAMLGSTARKGMLIRSRFILWFLAIAFVVVVSYTSTIPLFTEIKDKELPAVNAMEGIRSSALAMMENVHEYLMGGEADILESFWHDSDKINALYAGYMQATGKRTETLEQDINKLRILGKNTFAAEDARRQAQVRFIQSRQELHKLKIEKFDKVAEEMLYFIIIATDPHKPMHDASSVKQKAETAIKQAREASKTLTDTESKKIASDAIMAAEQMRFSFAQIVRQLTDIHEWHGKLEAVEHSIDDETASKLAEHGKNVTRLSGIAARNVIVSFVLGILNAFAVGMLLSRSITNPLFALRDAAGQIKKGRFVKVPIKTEDEFEEVGNAFNTMAAELAAEKRKTAERQKKLEKANDAITHMMARLKKAYTSLQDLDKMKEEFLSSTSHALRSPLTSMIGFIELMKEGKLGRTTKAQSEALKAIDIETKRLNDTVTKVLNISRVEAGRKLNLSSFDLNSVVKEVVAPLVLAARQKNIMLSLELKSLPKITADIDWIREVVQNFTQNAVKYTNKGSIVVKTERKGNKVHVMVTDTGMGIKKEFIQDLFSKFFQVSHTASGSGLGLYICKKIIEQHGGKVWVESEYGKGSTFAFEIPLK